MRFPFEGVAREVVERVRKSVLVIGQRGGFGAGIVWLPGIAVTNHHVARANRAFVEDSEGHTYSAPVLARDEENDLALVRVEPGIPEVEVADWRDLSVGQLLFALGHPLGERDSVTFGILSGLGNSTWMGEASRPLIQADLELAPGNSGGPIFDASGRVVAISTMIVSPGIALGVPSPVVARLVAGQAPRRLVA